LKRTLTGRIGIDGKYAAFYLSGKHTDPRSLTLWLTDGLHFERRPDGIMLSRERVRITREVLEEGDQDEQSA